MKRQSNDPGRRVAALGTIPSHTIETLSQRLRYCGDARHKLHPGNYGFLPPVNPRPTKSVCDAYRPLLQAEASALFMAGLRAGMVSPLGEGGIPKYVWAVDEAGTVYEAKTKPPALDYHGYVLGEDECDMRRYIVAEWSKRCPKG